LEALNEGNTFTPKIEGKSFIIRPGNSALDLRFDLAEFTAPENYC
jgi:hypothetical protein